MEKRKAPFFDLLGIEVLEAKDGRSKLSLAHKEELTNPYGRIHGGAIMTLVDSATALAVDSQYSHPFFTTKLEIKFKSTIDEGVLFAEAELVDKKKNFVIGDVKVTSEKGDLVAEAKVTFIVPQSDQKIGV